MKLLNSILISILILIGLRANLNAQSSIVFSHSKSGNMTERKVQVSMNARLANFNAVKDSTLVVPANFKIYPNPTSQYLNIEGDLPVKVIEAKLYLTNATGQIIKTDSYTGQLKTLNVSNLTAGFYLLEIRYSEKISDTYKIIITN